MNFGTKISKYPFRDELAEKLKTAENIKDVKKWLERTYGEVVCIRTLQHWARSLKMGDLVFHDEPPVHTKAAERRYMNKMQNMCWAKEQEIAKMKPGSPERQRAEKFVFDMYTKIFKLAKQEHEEIREREKSRRKKEKADRRKTAEKVRRLSDAERRELESKYSPAPAGGGNGHGIEETGIE